MAKKRYIKCRMGRTKPFDLYNPSSTGFERPIAKTVFARNIAKTLGMPGTCVSIFGPQSTSTRIDPKGASFGGGGGADCRRAACMLHEHKTRDKGPFKGAAREGEMAIPVSLRLNYSNFIPMPLVETLSGLAPLLKMENMPS